MSIASDLRVLYNLTFRRVRGGSHQERLEAFYRDQAGDYDAFRRKLLHGREELMQALPLPPGGRLLDMGGGTGSNLTALGDRLATLQSATVVDLCPSLLEAAQRRIQAAGWPNVQTALADVTTYTPDGGLVDAVTFSYPLTMIPTGSPPRARMLLKPGGTIGVVDFYVARKWPAAGMRRHSWFTRTFWPTWFGFDNVFPSPDHLPWLQTHFETVRLEERTGKVPYMPLVRAPYYLFVGRKGA
ncbi:MAG: class I SAM-dependent methyltransferase [Gemmataceae bacterium]